MAIRLIKQAPENNMYTCKDIYAGYGLPFSCANDKIALQAFKAYCITDQDGRIRAKYLELYKCGTFNRETGEYKNHKMKLIGKGLKYVQNSIQRESKNTSTNREQDNNRTQVSNG